MRRFLFALRSALLCGWRRHLLMGFRHSTRPEGVPDAPWSSLLVKFCVRCGKVIEGGRGYVRAQRNPK